MLPDSAVPRETEERLKDFQRLVFDEASRQNLISASTIEAFWERHIVDSAQLFRLGDQHGGTRWLDIGSGAGLPGVVLAVLGANVTLCEPRARRAAFLATVVDRLGLIAEVISSRVESVRAPPFDFITARAVGPIETLFGMALHLSDPKTRWILPRGKSFAEELARARSQWHGRFELVPSLTNDRSAIVVARAVRPKERR